MPEPKPETTPEPAADQAGHLASSLTEFSLKRRITVLVLLMTIVVVGFVATIGIPLELVPRGFTGQHLMVFIPWQNAPTQEVLDKITRPLEEEVSTVRGLERVNSYSAVGRCNVFLRFKSGTDMDVAYRELRDRVERARLQFPDDVDRVFLRKEDASGIPVLVLGLAIDPALTDYYNLIKKELIEPIERVDGVANVQADGLEEKEIIIEVDKQAVESNGLNIYRLSQELSGDNFTMASGHVRDAGKKFLLRSLASYESIEELQNRPITPTVRLKDIATIKYEEEEKRYSVRVNSRPAVALVVFKEGEANTVDVSRRIKAAIEEIKKSPRLSSIYMETLFNQGDVVVQSLKTLIQGGLIGGGFAALVLFIFLRRFRLTAIITLSIPLSLLIALIVMFFSNETLNVLTILALVIGVGMLVDNSIVVAENIHRWHKEGLPRREACIRGAGEIALAITMATLTTIVVFVPVALVEGQGQFFLMRLALPISVSLLASLLVALAFIPLSVYLTLPASAASGDPSWFQRWHLRLNAVLRHFYEITFERLNHLYNRLLAFYLRHRLDLILILALIFTFSYFFAYRKLEVVDQQEEDKTSFQIAVEISNEYSFEDLGDYFGSVEKLLEQKKEEFGLKGYFIFYRTRFGRIEGWFDLERPQTMTAKETAEKLLKELPRKPGIKLFYGRENQAEEAKGKEVFVVRFEGDDAQVLEDLAERTRPLLLSDPGVLGIRQSEEPAPSEMALVIDRDRASASRVSPEVIAGLVGYAIRGSSLPKYNDDGREIPVRIRFQESDRESLTDLFGFQIPAGDEAVLPLSAVAESRMLDTPKGIFRSNKKMHQSVTVELKSDQAKQTRERLMMLLRQINLPEGVSLGETGFPGMNEELRSLQMAAMLSIIFIYLLMGFLFESFILPLSIVLTIPLASIGVVWIHRLTGKDMDFLGIVGGILLVGVVVNNGIVLIDYVNRLRSEGLERTQALLKAADRRFRPIAMTALTTIIGMIPLVVTRPSEMGLNYKSFGLTLIGGMTTATILTLLVVPIFYTFFDDARLAAAAAVRRILAPKPKPVLQTRESP